MSNQKEPKAVIDHNQLACLVVIILFIMAPLVVWIVAQYSALPNLF